MFTTNIQFQLRVIKNKYIKLSKATGKAAEKDPLKEKILEVMSVQKHLRPDLIGCSDSGIVKRSVYLFGGILKLHKMCNI